MIEMKKWMGLAALTVLAACNSNPLGGTGGGDTGPGSAVFAMTNQTSNAVVVYPRDANGGLSMGKSFSTLGAGTNGSLGSQGALAVSRDGTWLVAVNAGSNDITMFRVTADSLHFIARTPSGGTKPVSVTIRGSFAYVLNAGPPANITAFKLSDTGPSPIAGSTRPLSGAADPQPAQVGFSADGLHVVVTEKATNKIDVYNLEPDGTTTGPIVNNSNGVTPFGFAFSLVTGNLVVSNANAPGGVPVVDGSSVTQYSLSGDGFLTPLDGPVPTTETAACWTVVTEDGRLAFVSNTGSNSITGFRPLAGLAIVDPDGKTAVTGTAPTELALASSGHLYVLNSGDGSIRGYRVSSTGALTQITQVTGLPAGAYGLTAN